MSDSLRALARRGELVRLRKGTQIIVEGDRGDTMYIVLKGQLRAYTLGEDDRSSFTYGHYGPGACVGEMGLDGGPRSAHVVAMEAVVCARILRHVLEQHLMREPAFAMELVTLVIQRARAATQGLRDLALLNVWTRLKRLLERLAVAQGDGTWLIEPAPSRRELAAELACVPTNVTKLFKPLQEGGYLGIARGRIVILKPLPRRI